MQRFKTALILAAACVSLPTAASAGMIDFTSNVWAGANGNAQATRDLRRNRRHGAGGERYQRRQLALVYPL